MLFLKGFFCTSVCTVYCFLMEFERELLNFSGVE